METRGEFPLTPAERRGIEEQRSLRSGLRRRGDEHLRLVWVWHGDTLKMLEIDKYKVMIEPS